MVSTLLAELGRFIGGIIDTYFLKVVLDHITVCIFTNKIYNYHAAINNKVCDINLFPFVSGKNRKCSKVCLCYTYR